MEAGQRAHHALLLVQDGVCTEPAFQHGVPHVVDIVVQMEADQILGLADVGDGQGVVNETHRPVRVVLGGDDAGAGLHVQQLLAHLCLTDDDAVDLHLQRPADHIRLVAADDDAVPVGEEQVLPAHRQCDGHLAGDRIPQLAVGIEDLAL